MDLPQPILRIIHLFNQNGYACYVVGGAVRDHFLSKPVSDYDLCTSAYPSEMEHLFLHSIPTGIKHGTITILEGGMKVECTTFRIEENYADHRHPEVIRFGASLEEDLARRDFTINAIAYHPQEGIIDPFGGLDDLNHKIIRAIQDPNLRFQEDALRMIRAHRFAAKLHFQIEEKTAQAIEANADLIQEIAVERIRKEIDEILKEEPFEIVKMLSLLDPWIPELRICFHCAQNSPYHTTNVLEHILAALSYLDPFDSVIAWALLLHDLGKPASKTTDDRGCDHFYGHPQKSVLIAQRILNALKFSNKEKKDILDLVLYHDDVREPSLKWLYTYRVLLHWDDRKMEQLFQVQYCDIMAHSQKGRERLQVLERMRFFYQEEKTKRPLSLKELAIKGNEVIEWTESKGKAIQKALQACLEYAFYHPQKNTKEDLKKFLEKGNVK